ncbi:Hypothetical predicted protein [Olea europaea subsp. europaea]|uniref:Uncharacterized protein n=1 Tax=Olea europaea subsp. europaea TaxID=158383 RepID=A0A8S0QZ69_OLEEU|nr:Hypothetical predicted protein [Olea europaea subsp. europaea]
MLETTTKGDGGEYVTDDCFSLMELQLRDHHQTNFNRRLYRHLFYICAVKRDSILSQLPAASDPVLQRGEISEISCVEDMKKAFWAVPNCLLMTPWYKKHTRVQKNFRVDS